jgi:hypothetical protein
MDPSYASLVVIDDTGQIVWNVLSEEISSLDIPRHSYIEVKKAAEVTPASTSTITLKKKGDKVSLVVSGGGQERQLDVSNWQEDLVEIEERPEVQKLAIGVRGDKFTLNQKGVTAETPYPISVDSEKAEISLETPTGAKFVSVLPLEAVESALRTNLMSRITDHNVEMLEKESELQYSIQGEKVFNFFKMFDYSIPVNLFVSASTGKVLDLEAPGWFRFINFLFV